MKKEFYLVSLYDMAFSLIFFFLFLSVYYISIIKEERVKQKKNILQINIGEKELFNEGEFVFKDESLAIEVIKSNLNLLYNLWIKNPDLKQKRIKNILVIGHTDNVDIGAKLKKRYNNPNYSNWNLSLDRANQVVNLIINEKIFEYMPELSYSMLLPAGKSYFIPSTENLRNYCKNVLKISEIIVDGKKISLEDANSDQIIKFLNNKFSLKVLNNIIADCNLTKEQREKNRRIEIRLELWE